MIRPPVTYQMPPIRSAIGNSPNKPQRVKRLWSSGNAFMPPNGVRLSGEGRAGATGGASRTPGVSPRSGGMGLSARSAITLLLLGIGGVFLLDRLAQVFFDDRKLRDHLFDGLPLDA